MRGLIWVFVLAFLAAPLFAVPAPARADIQNDIFQVLCMPELDVLEVRELKYYGKTVHDAIKRPNEKLAKAYGIYSPAWSVKDHGMADLPRIRIESANFECALSVGLAKLELHPERLPRSSGHYTISLTLSIAGRLIVDDVPFAFCRTGGPIRRFVYNATEGYFTIEGKFGGLRERSPDPTKVDKNDWRLFFVKDEGISALQTEALKWRFKNGALQSSDIDYWGVDYDKAGKFRKDVC